MIVRMSSTHYTDEPPGVGCFCLVTKEERRKEERYTKEWEVVMVNRLSSIHIYSTWILLTFGFSAFGTVTLRIPFFRLALTLS